MWNGYVYGLDVGSTTAKLVILDLDFRVHHESGERTYGKPLETACRLLEAIPRNLYPDQGARIIYTGTAGRLLLDVLGGDFINEIIAHTTAAIHFYPHVRTILDMGGQDTKLMTLSPGADQRPQIEDFSLNNLCAAGTGSFLDQQAERLGLTIQQFSELATRSDNPARLAGRCTVFAKSDMIHLQQNAVPDCDIVAGLCMAVVRNLKATLTRGKRLRAPMVFQGGVAANLGVQAALRSVFSLGRDELVIPSHHRTMGAIGAALYAMQQGEENLTFRGLDALRSHLMSRPARVKRHSVLAPPSNRQKDDKAFMVQAGASNPVFACRDADLDPVQGILGIDVGSVSTKMVVIEPLRGEVIASYYGPTAGHPLDALQYGLGALNQDLPAGVRITAVGTTGSGRHLAGDFVGADAVINEITAQAEAAVFLDPKVDTIFEIGGQDSKYISLQNGTVVDFMMNRACAAGTGSFLEEQAGRLGIGLEDFGDLALSARSPVKMGERCTVFMESDLVHYLQQGVSTPDLVAGLSYSIVQNYLNKVVEERPVGKRIFYQGATALNLGVVAAFEAILGRKIIVPPNCNLTGAMGAALLAGKAKKEVSAFRGFDITATPYEMRTFECTACPNQCSISQVKVSGRRPLFYGGRCERYERGVHTRQKELPDLVERRQEALLDDCYQTLEEARSCPRGAVGLPLALLFHEWLPFFSAFFKELGFGPVISGPTTKALIRLGVENVVNEPCFPVKVAHGHVLTLIQAGVERIFFPSFIDLPGHGKGPAQVCPYVQGFPYTLSASVDFSAHDTEFLSLPLRIGGKAGIGRKIIRDLAHLFQTSRRQVTRGVEAGWMAQRRFNERTRKLGDDVISRLSDGDRAVVLVGRPYNALDPGSNLDLHRKLRRLGMTVLPMDALPLEAYFDQVPEIESMYWSYGQKILSAGAAIRDNPHLDCVYVTNFGCGPDSFLLHFFREILGDKPFLEIEIDEHSADAGALTRLEAFLDTVGAKKSGKKSHKINSEDPVEGIEKKRPTMSHAPIHLLKQRTIYLPHMSDHAYALAAAITACGGHAEVLFPSDEESVTIGLEHTSGKECYPAILTTGDMIKLTRRADFSPEKAAFFMPSGGGPCRFGQYHRLHRRVLNNMGLGEVPIYTPVQDISLYDELGIMGKGFSRLAWQGIVAVDLLDRLTRSIRPYALDQQGVDRLYSHSLERLCAAVSDKQSLAPILHDIRQSYEKVKVQRRRDPVVVGIVGEIYTRVNPYANAFLVRELEALGVEVWLPTVSEWIFYINFTARRRAWRSRSWREYMKQTLENHVQVKDVQRLEAAMGPLPGGREPLTKDLLAWAAPFVSDEFEGETVLSVGKAVEYLHLGVAGLINVMPFSCMPGNIVNAILTSVRARVGSRPFLALSCDGQQNTGRRLRLEAFAHQAKKNGFSPAGQ